MSEEELKKQYYALVMVQWELIKRHIKGDNKSDEYWQSLIDDVNQTVLAVENKADQEYIKSCLLALMEHFVKRYRDGKRE